MAPVRIRLCGAAYGSAAESRQSARLIRFLSMRPTSTALTRCGSGGALPSLTYLIGETGLAVQTVRRGIAVLVEEDWAYNVPGRGTYAAEKPSA